MISKLRRFAAAALLGLPAALVAHTLLFGHEHAAGGSHHGAAFAASIVAALLVVILHMRERFDRFPSVTLSAAVWFALLELSEHPHAIAVLPAALALLAAALLLRATVHVTASSLRAIAGVLSSVRVLRAAERSALVLRYELPGGLQIAAHRFRLFSRPPPLLS